MKTLAIANQKGGVGKSALACQLAYYAALKRGLRTLVIDLDHQANTTTALSMGGHATVATLPASELFTGTASLDQHEPLTVIGADAAPLRNLESESDKHNEFVTNLSRSLSAIGKHFDLCIIDVNPSPDVRHIGTLIVASHVVSPVQMTRESIDGLAALINDPEIGIARIREQLNPNMQFIGLLPNLVERFKLQSEIYTALIEKHGDLLIRLPATDAEKAQPRSDGSHRTHVIASINKSAAIFEAQSNGLPLWLMKTEPARKAIPQVQRVCEQLLVAMNLIETQQ